jgi:predicted metal-dependent hydrolase
MAMHVRPASDVSRRRQLMEEWYRGQIKQAVPELIEKWQRRLGVRVAGFHVQRMRTQWGSCNAARRTIRLNTDLARKPRQCLEYIIVHELIHLRVRHHNEQFTKLIDKHLPNWRHLRQLLNSMPLAHGKWGY